MAEIHKLSVGQTLDKLRGADAPKPGVTRLDDEIENLDQEIRRLKAARRRLEQDQEAGLTGSDAQKANAAHFTKLKILVTMIGLVIVIILAWMWSRI